MDYLDYRELYHSGIKGMKWGVRRYQNEDGSLTPAGRSRYSETNSESKKSLGLQRSSKRSDAKTVETIRGKELKYERGILSDTSSALNQASGAIRPKKGKTKYGSYNMSDAELRNKVNRLMLERQYSDLVGDTKYKQSGSQIVKDVLSTVGAITGIAATSLGIYAGIKNLKGMK